MNPFNLPSVQQDILGVVNETPGISIQGVSMQVGVAHSTVLRVLQEQLYPYHLQHVHVFHYKMTLSR
jgi:hypothetical protein